MKLSILTCSALLALISTVGVAKGGNHDGQTNDSFQVRLIIKDKATLNKLNVEDFTLRVFSWGRNAEIPLVINGELLTLPEPGSYSISGTAPNCGTLQGFGNRYFDASTEEAASFVRCN